MDNPTVLIWCGNQPNQIALSCKIAEKFNLIGIVAESKRKKKKISLKIFIKIYHKLLFKKVDNAWFGLLKYYKSKYPKFPETELLITNDINSDEVYSFSQKKKPDLIIVSGTHLIKGKLLNLSPSIGILNLHTGISPYIKGGPNCTNWCLSNDEFHLIGNTVMWLNEEIDGGRIISTEFVEFTGKENLNEIHFKVMENAHDLYLRTIEKVLSNPSGYKGIKQEEIGASKLYSSKKWGCNQKRRLLLNIRGNRFYEIINSEKYKKEKEKIKLVELK